MGNETVRKAMAFAFVHLAGLERPTLSREPKCVHAHDVAQRVRMAGGGAEEIAAGYLHDVAEDTGATLADIEEAFGPAIADLVAGLTDPPEFAAMPLALRKAAQARRLAGESRSCKLVKLCDQCSNLQSLLVDPPLDWTASKTWSYFEGALGLARECEPEHPALFAEFMELYEQGSAAYAGRG